MLAPRSLYPLPEDVEAARGLLSSPPAAAIVLGSGLGAVADRLGEPRVLGYDSVVGMRGSTHVAGHGGRLVVGEAGGVEVLAFQGRLHTYQGVSAHEAAYPARLAAALGAKVLIVTNAAGGVNPSLSPGDLMLITDHINLLGDNPLRAWPGPDDGAPFVPLGDAYSVSLRDRARSDAEAQGLALAEGVYAAVPGPSYETPAEVRALRAAGVDAVGMSTVPEVIAARALWMEVLGISLITNLAGGSELSHEEVLAVGRAAETRLADLLSAILNALWTA